MAASSSALLRPARAASRASPLAVGAFAVSLTLLGCHDRLVLSQTSREAGGSSESTPGSSGASSGDGSSAEAASGGEPTDTDGGAAGAGPNPRPASGAETRTPRRGRDRSVCSAVPAPARCRVEGDPKQGLRLVGTLLNEGRELVRGSIDLDAQGMITCAACDCGPPGRALTIDCPELSISAGFINLHDHLSYAGTPPLVHTGELYQHRNDWRLGEHGHPALAFAGSAKAAVVLAQELRLAMGGATSVVGAGGKAGLLRNLDVAGLSEGLLPGAVISATFPLGDSAGGADRAPCGFGRTPDTLAALGVYRAYVAHIGEGVDDRATRELECALGPLALLDAKSAVVHAMALGADSAVKLARAGSSVVWSPRSNLDLYGATTPAALLASLGVRLALGTDWLATGSMNLLRELACAKKFDSEVQGGYFDAADLLGMVTHDAAWALGLESGLGALRVGMAGDISVFSGPAADGYERVVNAQAADVALVLRGGQPLYGDADLVAAFAGAKDCARLDVCGAAKLACAAGGTTSITDIIGAGEEIYPLFSCDEPPPNEPRCEVEPSRLPAPALRAPEPLRHRLRDSDDDGVSDANDLCPRAFDPAQADADADGHGDACDACPPANPGLSACALGIAELRGPATRLPLGSAVRLSDVHVSALKGGADQGFFVESGDHADFSGLFAYTAAKRPNVFPGDLVTLEGYYSRYRDLDELSEPRVIDRRLAREPLAALEITDREFVPSRREALASLYVRLRDAQVLRQNPDAPADYDETGLASGLRLDDALLPDLDNLYPPNTRFAPVLGIFGASFGQAKLWPLDPPEPLPD